MPKRKASKNKSKRPWNPVKDAIPKEVVKQLGLSERRLQHSKEGFDAEPTGIGHNRLRERSMLTPPGLLAERWNLKMRAYADQGKEPDQDVQINQTPSDRATAQWRRVLWNYLETRVEDVTGKSIGINYEGSSKSSELHRLPLSDSQFNHRKFYNWLRHQPGWRELCDFLDDIAAQCNPQAHGSDYRIMSKAEIGAWLLDNDNPRDAKCATDGALSLVCRALAGAQAHFAAMERQEKILLKSRN